jgi:hypothetical protein
VTTYKSLSKNLGERARSKVRVHEELGGREREESNFGGKILVRFVKIPKGQKSVLKKITCYIVN